MAVRCEGKKSVRNSSVDSKDRGGGRGRGAPPPCSWGSLQACEGITAERLGLRESSLQGQPLVQ